MSSGRLVIRDEAQVSQGESVVIKVWQYSRSPPQKPISSVRQLRRPLPKGLAQGESLARAPLISTTTFSEWGWVGTEVFSVTDIGPQHRAAACGFRKHICKNRHALTKSQASPGPAPETDPHITEDDIVVISSDDEPECSPKTCKTNPNCCNYLGQQKWENDGTQFLSY